MTNRLCGERTRRVTKSKNPKFLHPVVRRRSVVAPLPSQNSVFTQLAKNHLLKMSSIPRFRHFGDEAPQYGAKNDFFTLEVHHGGKFFNKPNNVVYEHGYVMFVDFVLPRHFTRGMLNKFCDACGCGGEMTFYYKKRGLSLGKGLVRLKSEADVREMLRDRNGQRDVQIYVVGPQASLSLAMEAFEEHDDGLNNEGIGLGSDNNGGCYVPTMQRSSDMEVDKEGVDEYIFNQEDIWSQFEESLVYNDLPTDVGNVSDEGGAREPVRGES
ncbi:hypothetical protein Adt_24197 [Abeliophyllum distichum]|uniref:PB1-like domain-containing protein n=1 Tax=Abeliophyllum distichum TaxID=126358 RepID=A0ABD1SD19_9LAMI